jgi:hypothetical protein
MTRMDLNSVVDKGGAHALGARIGPMTASGSVLSPSPLSRTSFENCAFSDVKVRKCVMGFPIFKSCTFRNVESDFLRCYGAVFLECRLEGRIRGISFGICPELEAIDEAKKKSAAKEAMAMVKSSKYCLDVREAILSEVGFYGQAIARKVIFSKGQCVLFRGKDMPQKLESLAKNTKDRALQMALFTVVAPGESLHLVSMETCGTTERVDEIRSLLSKVDLEVLDEPHLD